MRLWCSERRATPRTARLERTAIAGYPAVPCAPARGFASAALARPHVQALVHSFRARPFRAQCDRADRALHSLRVRVGQGFGLERARENGPADAREVRRVR